MHPMLRQNLTMWHLCSEAMSPQEKDMNSKAGQLPKTEMLYISPVQATLKMLQLLFLTLDEKKGTEKKTASILIVKAKDLRTAVKYTDEHMKGSMADYELASVAETAYMDVFLYNT